MCKALQITAKTPSEAMMAVIPVTTAFVVASPTAAALLPERIPRKHPAYATRNPKNEPFAIPNRKLLSSSE
jgi:hypothetical protein